MALLDLLPRTSEDVTPELQEKFRKALEEFREPQDSDLVTRSDVSIRQHPNADIEGYFEWVTRTGKSAIPWNVIRPAFLWKVKFVLEEMARLEKAKLKDGEEIKLDKDTEFKLKFIQERAAEYEGPPFTFQRICELLITPSRHYKKFEKYIRALDKNINVVTTVTELGFRITGSEWPMPENPGEGKVEQHFFGQVDELDGLPRIESGDFNPTTERAAVPFGPVMPLSLVSPKQEVEESIEVEMKESPKTVEQSVDPETAESHENAFPEQTATISEERPSVEEEETEEKMDS